MNRLNKYTKEARQALSNAREEALQLRHRTIGPEHLLLGILNVNDPIIDCILSKLQVSSTRLRQALEFVVGRGNKALVSEPTLSSLTRAVLLHAERESMEMGGELTGIEHLFLGLLDDAEGVAVGILESFGLYLDTVRQHILELLSNGREYARFAAQYLARYNETPTLNLVSRDLTAAALAGMLDPLIGREAELERTMQILS